MEHVNILQCFSTAVLQRIMAGVILSGFDISGSMTVFVSVAAVVYIDSMPL